MCGRFSLDADMEVLLEQFELPGLPTDLPKRWNIAPTQPVLTITEKNGVRIAADVRWGLIPFYSKDARHPLVNVRGETVQSKAFFHRLWEKGQRCLIPATGFYEWRTLGKGRKQPVYLHLKDRRPFAFAGLWDSWKDGDTRILTCTIVTTEPNDLLASLHDRMPVILPPALIDRWLRDPDEATLKAVLEPYPADAMASHPVSGFVNNANHEGPECIDPVEDTEPTLF